MLTTLCEMASSSEEIFSPAASHFLTLVADDFTELFALRSFLQRLEGPMSPRKERIAGLRILSEFLDAGLVKVGEFRSDVLGLQYWEGSLAEIEDRIARAWNIKSPPGMGEPPWFFATDEGKRAEARIRRPRVNP
jgi:hypothetical protein